MLRGEIAIIKNLPGALPRVVLSYQILSNNNPGLEKRIKHLESILAPLYPELDQVTLRVRIKKLKRAVAEYDHRSFRIYIDPRPFDPDQNTLLPSVLAHETTHALKYLDRRVPHGERSCDIYMLARLPINLYPKERDFYVKVPQNVLYTSPDKIIETAKRAIKLRGAGLRNYIVWFENELQNARFNYTTLE